MGSTVQKKYHLEISLRNLESAKYILEILKKYNIDFKILEKAKGYSIYTKDGEELIRYIANGNTIIIPEGVKVIRTGAVQGKEIRKLKLPSTLIELKAMSLNSVTGLDTVYIPENVEAFESTVLPNDAKVVVSESNKNIKSQ